MILAKYNLMSTLHKIWWFGDDLNTDLIISGKFVFSPVECAAPHTLATIRPDFADNVAKGDVIVAGNNIGCGSSREIAVKVLKYLGIKYIIAESFARTFFRNAISIGLPALIVPGIKEIMYKEDCLKIDINNLTIECVNHDNTYKIQPLSSLMQQIISNGGIVNMIKEMALGKK